MLATDGSQNDCLAKTEKRCLRCRRDSARVQRSTRLTDALDAAFVTRNLHIDLLEDEVVFDGHLIAWSNDQVRTRSLDRLERRSRLGGRYRVQHAQAHTRITAVGHTISELGVATHIQETEQDVGGRFAIDGFADFY